MLKAVITRSERECEDLSSNIRNHDAVKSCCVIYARYSSSSQTDQSIEGQVRVCREFCRNSSKKRTTRT